MRVGLMVSRIVIVWVQLARFPQPSVAVQVRRMDGWPVQLALPKASLKVMFATPLHVSVAVATPVLLVVVGTVHSKVMFVGQTITGGTLSLKLMVCTQLEVLPHASAAVHVRRIVPLPVQLVVLKVSTKLMLVTALHVSLAVAKPVLAVSGDTVHSSVILGGQVIMGGVVSLKRIVCTQLD